MRGVTKRAMLFEVEDLDDFFENAALSLHWVGADGTIVRANQFELDFLGYERDEYEGRHIADFHVDRDVIDDILERLTAGETLKDYPAKLRAKDGSVKHVLINSNVRWLDGQFVHTRCFTRDITETVKAQRALARTKKELERTVEQRTAELRDANDRLQELLILKDRFVAIVSHELRTPLTSISGFSATMQRYWDSLEDDQKRSFVSIISEQSERLGRLVNDLLIVSRLSAGAIAVRSEKVPLREIAARTVRELDMGDIVVSGPATVRVAADPDYLQQILVNYIANARNYGAPPIEVRARKRGQCGELLVIDNGEGVREEFRPHLFSEFAQAMLADRATTQPGTGLGLSIVRRLAEAQGGSVWYEPAPGGGAVFGVRLPLWRAS